MKVAYLQHSFLPILLHLKSSVALEFFRFDIKNDEQPGIIGVNAKRDEKTEDAVWILVWFSTSFVNSKSKNAELSAHNSNPRLMPLPLFERVEIEGLVSHEINQYLNHKWTPLKLKRSNPPIKRQRLQEFYEPRETRKMGSSRPNIVIYFSNKFIAGVLRNLPEDVLSLYWSVEETPILKLSDDSASTQVHYHSLKIVAAKSTKKFDDVLGPLKAEVIFEKDTLSSETVLFDFANLVSTVPESIYDFLSSQLEQLLSFDNILRTFACDDANNEQHKSKFKFDGDGKKYISPLSDHVVEYSTNKELCYLAILFSKTTPSGQWIIGGLFAKSHTTKFKFHSQHGEETIQFGFWPVPTN
uniref:AlNc14C182G8243 protein n=1 Tax=Albugo laibachii Nc14 TaxID=890382 RepID=F0WP95_9STRA|nr:AlNc14C182G8243 [Albugo laibachii Nc14]|eukprot:CCA23141.1 AlNc14C182G8243 [Albugo laibachii Nc14]